MESATVFLIEDDAGLRASLQWLLTSHGYRVVASASSTEAIAIYNPSVLGCLLLDFQLPEVTGLELLEQFRRLGGEHPFIVMTAYGRVPLAVEAMRSGAIDFLEKPFENSQLLHRIQEAVAKDASRRQIDLQVGEVQRQIGLLGAREWQVANLVAEGQTSKQIATRLGIKPKTVEVHRHHILTKLKFNSAVELTAFVMRAQSLIAQGKIRLSN